jgi:hypothetical protein
VNRNLIAPLTGVAFVVIAIVAFAVGGEPPNAKDNSPQEIVKHYVDNKDAIMVTSILAGIAGALLIFFAAYLRKVLSAAAGAGSMLPGVVLVGASIMAVGFAIDTTIAFALADAADDIDPIGVQTLQALWDNDFIPVAMGIVVFLFSAGLAIVQTGALPKWLGWIAIVLAIIGLTPIGFAAFLGGALWILIVSVVLTMRARTVPPQAAPAV